jgi:hypothetical protein
MVMKAKSPRNAFELKHQEDKYTINDFEATVVARDAIRLDIYDDEIFGENRGMYSKVCSIPQMMAMVILMTRAIERAEVADAQAATTTKKKAKK